MTTDTQFNDRLDAVAQIVSAYVSGNKINAGDVPALISSTYAALMTAVNPAPKMAEIAQKPAVPVKKSVTPDFLISLEDGRKFKSLKRHLGGLGMTPDQYRAKWGLPSDYPMVAASYSEKRAEVARNNGLGRKAEEASSGAETGVAAPLKATRRKPS